MRVSSARIVVIGHDRRMVEPPPTPHRERWLHIVHDGESAPDEDPGRIRARTPRSGLGPGFRRVSPATRPVRPTALRRSGRTGPEPGRSRCADPPRPNRRRRPGRAGWRARPRAGRWTGQCQLRDAGPAATVRTGQWHGRPRRVASRAAGCSPTVVAGRRRRAAAGGLASSAWAVPDGGLSASAVRDQPGAAPRGGGGAVQAPPRPAPADRVGAGRWVIVRAGPGGGSGGSAGPGRRRPWGRRWRPWSTGWSAGSTGGRRCSCSWCSPCRSGTACRRGSTTRLAEVVAVVAAVAVLWFGLAALRPEGWWRAEIAYGIACGIAGTAHALLSRRRTVEP